MCSPLCPQGAARGPADTRCMCAEWAKCENRQTEGRDRQRDTLGDVGRRTVRGKDLRERGASRKRTRVAERDRGTALARGKQTQAEREAEQGWRQEGRGEGRLGLGSPRLWLWLEGGPIERKRERIVGETDPVEEVQGGGGGYHQTDESFWSPLHPPYSLIHRPCMTSEPATCPALR